jgi:hypothetical protein
MITLTSRNDDIMQQTDLMWIESSFSPIFACSCCVTFILSNPRRSQHLLVAFLKIAISRNKSHKKIELNLLLRAAEEMILSFS